MSTSVKIPSVGESVSEVTIASWVKNDGETVSLDDVICEVESDKATVEITAESGGVLKIKVAEGETIPIGTEIAIIEASAGTSPRSASTSDSISMAPPTAPAPPQPPPQFVEEAPAIPQSPPIAQTLTPSPSLTVNGPQGHASPAARKILDEREIQPSSITGTGRDGRITKSDALNAQGPNKVLNMAQGALAKESAPQMIPTSAIPKINAGARNSRREKMSSMRKTIAKRLVEVKNTTAMLTTFNEVDMKAVMDVRKKYKDMFKNKHDINLGFMSFFTKAVTMSLQNIPALNAMIDGTELVFHDYCDIGVAVSTPRGLVVPVVRNAEMMSLAQIEKEILSLAQKGRDNKLSIKDMTGGTFTITNGGVFGSMLSTPIINSPQSAILGMHNIVERPVVRNGEVVIRPIMYLALSYDHRIVDGKESVTFLKSVKEHLEDPIRLLLDI